MKSCDIIPAIRTDQDAISIEISELENEQKGPGYWKMNCSMLKDEEYVNNVTEMLPVWSKNDRFGKHGQIFKVGLANTTI